MASLFTGFSTFDKDHKHNTLKDIELIKRDLLNHFHTRKGERVMMPDFGSIVWDMMFEPLTDAAKALIEEDVRRIVTSDPRLELDGVGILNEASGIRLVVNLIYVPFNAVGTLEVEFDRRAAEGTSI